jgi:hypothetical protein
MAGTLWVPGAERITPSLAGGSITSTAPPRVVWHTTEAPSGKPAMFQSMINVLKNKSAEPQILWDPITDRLGQFMALNLSGRALKNDTDGTRNNRMGRVCIQIEVIGYAKNPFTDDWKPGKNFRALMAAIRSWGIPDVFPMGPPPKFPGGSRRDRTIWRSKGGHYCHANIPGNDHGDPGAISPAKLFAAAGTTPSKPPAPTPAEEEDSMAGLTKADITQAFKDALAAERPIEDARQTFDNKHDSQEGAWMAAANAVAQVRAKELMDQGMPVPEVITTVKNEVWGPLSPLWNS